MQEAFVEYCPLNGAPKCVHEPSAVVKKLLHRLEKGLVSHLVYLVSPVLLGDLHKNFFVVCESDTLFIAIKVQRNQLIGHAYQITLAGARKLVIHREMPEFPGIEIRIQFAVDAFQ